MAATLASALVARVNPSSSISSSMTNVQNDGHHHHHHLQHQRRIARQTPSFSSIYYAADSSPRENSANYYYSGDQATGFVDRLRSNPPPQRDDFYGVGGRLPQGNSFSTPEDRLITNRDPSIVTVMENAMSRVFLPIAQALAPPLPQ